MAWVFTDSPDIPRVTAASAIVLCDRFGFVPNDEGLRKAKVQPGAFLEALEVFRLGNEATGDLDLVRAAEELVLARGERLRVTVQSLLSYLPVGDEADRNSLARDIADGLLEFKLTPWHRADLDAVLPTLRLLLQHCQVSVAGRGRHQLSMLERDFQEEVIQYLLTQNQNQSIRLDREHIGERGRVDIVVHPNATVRQRIAIELKAEQAEFENIVRTRLAQPFHYAADPTYCRIALLYCRFRSNQARRPASFVRIEGAGDERAPLVVICVGQQATSASASGQSEF